MEYMENIKSVVIDILGTIIENEVDLQEYFSTENDLRGLGLSSLQYIQLIVLLEDYFNIEFGDEVFYEEYFKDIDKLVNNIQAKA